VQIRSVILVEEAVSVVVLRANGGFVSVRCRKIQLTTIRVLSRTYVIREVVDQIGDFFIFAVSVYQIICKEHGCSSGRIFTPLSVTSNEHRRLVGVLTGCLVGDRYLRSEEH